MTIHARCSALLGAFLLAALLTGCVPIQKNLPAGDPFTRAPAATEGAVFISVTHAGGRLRSWDRLHVRNVKSGAQYVLSSVDAPRISNTRLFAGALPDGDYQVFELFTGGAGGPYSLGMGGNAANMQFHVSADTVNDLGRLLVGGPLDKGASFVVEQSRSFVGNRPYIERHAPGWLDGRTIAENRWTVRSEQYYLSNYGRVVANGYDAMIADAEGNVYTGNRMGVVLKIREQRSSGTSTIGLFDAGPIDTIRALLLIGDEMIVGGDMPSLPVVNLTNKKKSQLSTKGLENGPVVYLHRGPRQDIYAVVCNDDKLTVQHCGNRQSCEWNTVRTFERGKIPGASYNAGLCGAAAYQGGFLVYLNDAQQRSALSTYDTASGTWLDQVVPMPAKSLAVNYGKRIVVARDGGGLMSDAPVLTISDDGGKTWQNMKAPTLGGQPTTPIFVDENEGYIVSDNTSVVDVLLVMDHYQLLKTIDGGKSWQVLRDPFRRITHFFPINTPGRVFATRVDEEGHTAIVSITSDGAPLQLLDGTPKISKVNGQNVQ